MRLTLNPAAPQHRVSAAEIAAAFAVPEGLVTMPEPMFAAYVRSSFPRGE
jgi:hypothetical protein